MRLPLARGLLLALVVLCTIHKLANGPVWDDVAIFDEIGRLQQRGQTWSVLQHSTLDLVFRDEGQTAAEPLDLFRPLALLSFAAGYALAGAEPWIHHLMNTALHVACVALVFSLGRLLTGRAGVALFAAAWFGLAPVLIETHVWISGRFDLLSTCLGLLGVSCWRRGCETKSLTWHASGAVAFLGGLLAKEPLLFALPALIAWPAPQPLGLRARLLGAWPLCVSGALYLAWRALATDSSSALPSVNLPLAAAHVPVLLLDGALHLALPLRVFPRALHEDYAALGPSVLAGALLVVGIAAVALVRARRTHPLALFSALFFACTLAPVALVTVRLWPGFGRYLYLPASLALPGAALALHRCSEQLRPHLRFRRLPEVAAVAYLLALALRSHVATYAYASDETLFSAVIAEAPERSHGYGFWGMSEAAAGRHARAVPLLKAAVERSPDERRWAAQYGSELLFSGDTQGALQIAERYIARLRSAPEFHLLAAYALLGRDHHAAAVHVLECLLEDPKHAQGRDALTFLRTKHPQAEDFRAQFRALLRESRYASLQGGG